MPRTIRALLAYTLLLLAFAAQPRGACAQFASSAFTYQGELRSGTSAYTGSADFQFRLFPSLAGPGQLGPALTASDVACDGGRFTVRLDFLMTIPNGAHIEISARTPHDPTDTAVFTKLDPRQPVTAAPQAYAAEVSGYAESANLAANALSLGGQLPAFYQNASNLTTGTLPSGRLSGTYSLAVGFTNAGNAISGSGAGLTGLNAGSLLTGTVSPARGGTGSSIAAATPGQVLKWNGAAFTPQDDLDTNTTYSAGSGLSLAGTTFSIPTGGVTGAMVLDGSLTSLDLATDAASLSKVSGGALTISGGSATLGTSAPVLALQSTSNGGSARLDLFETVAGGVGGRLQYDGAANVVSLGTVDAVGGPIIPAITLGRGSNVVTTAGNLNVGGEITIPTTARNLMLVGADFTPLLSSSQYTNDSSGIVGESGNAASLYFAAPIHVPDGAVITGFTLYALDNNASGSISVQLRSVSMPAGTDTVLASIVTSGASPFVRSETSGAISHTVNNGLRGLIITASWANNPSQPSDQRLIGVRVEYTIAAPLP